MTDGNSTPHTKPLDNEQIENIINRAHLIHHSWERGLGAVRHMGPRKEYQIEYWVIKAMEEMGYVKN